MLDLTRDGNACEFVLNLSHPPAHPRMFEQKGKGTSKHPNRAVKSRRSSKFRSYGKKGEVVRSWTGGVSWKFACPSSCCFGGPHSLPAVLRSQIADTTFPVRLPSCRPRTRRAWGKRVGGLCKRHSHMLSVRWSGPLGFRMSR